MVFRLSFLLDPRDREPILGDLLDDCEVLEKDGASRSYIYFMVFWQLAWALAARVAKLRSLLAGALSGLISRLIS